jgi:hypothetical protein
VFDLVCVGAEEGGAGGGSRGADRVGDGVGLQPAGRASRDAHICQRRAEPFDSPSTRFACSGSLRPGCGAPAFVSPPAQISRMTGMMRGRREVFFWM